MILLSVGIIALILAVVAVVMCIVFDVRNSPFINTFFGISAGIAAGIFLICLIFAVGLKSDIKELEADYAELTLYQSTIEACENEYVKFDFYEKVNKYNEQYARFEKFAASPWTDKLVKKDWRDNISIIVFELDPGYYYGD